MVSPTNIWEEQYSLRMECFTVPADRLLVNIPRHNFGEGCRAVVVTTVFLEKRENVIIQQSNKLSNLNSVLYTPVLQWFGLDVKKQGNSLCNCLKYCLNKETNQRLNHTTTDWTAILFANLAVLTVRILQLIGFSFLENCFVFSFKEEFQ